MVRRTPRWLARSQLRPAERLLHVTRTAQARYTLPPATFGMYGRVLLLDPAAAADWSERVSLVRAQCAPGVGELPAVSPGQVLAAVALHELMHALIAVFTAPGAEYDGALRRGGQSLLDQVGAEAVRDLEGAFRATFVPSTGQVQVQEEAGGNSLLLEELLLLDLARRNSAYGPFADLFTSDALRRAAAYVPAVSAVETEVGRQPGVSYTGRHGAAAGRSAGVRADAAPNQAGSTSFDSGAALSLLALLLEPQSREPGSLAGQLTLAAELWAPYLGAGYQHALRQALRAADLLREEYTPPPGPPAVSEPDQTRVYEPLDDDEVEAFSADSGWMPGVVLVAKSTYVWLAQLSARFGYEINTLDAVPDEALTELADQGFNALWLIGVWWRSEASRTIKRVRGQPDALASAYSIRAYVVAPELGGDEALARLREKAARRGIRLASDMVPNHTAIDAGWVVDHPEWFVQAARPPFAGYRFTGPDLSPDPRVTLRIEDHYYDGSDAAVVFQRVDNVDGDVRYIYHGNDGTALPWNDTAQLNFLSAEVRRAVIDTTVAVARSFPLIRLDAAMTLARRHVRRLWHPQPGEGGAVPSRTLLAESRAEFDRQMPAEFWRELVDRLAVEAPDTMLLAEAFWLMEVYFVRTLGMHRVYNSAFMHMTLAEQNAEYRQYLKRYMTQSPQVLARFVNYMSNPDEEPSAAQFGNGDKAFGVAALLATLPGLPMFGHGQVEGLTEKYGMEFARPRYDEAPRMWHVERHMREIAPLLRRRHLFAGGDHFRLFDLVTGDGGVSEDAYVFSNGAGRERVLVAYNNSPQHVAGAVRVSAPVLHPGGGEQNQSLVDALALDVHAQGEAVLSLLGGAELRVGVAELAQSGLRIELGPYQVLVFVAVRQELPAQEAGPSVVRTKRRPRCGAAVLAGPRGVGRKRRSARRRR